MINKMMQLLLVHVLPVCMIFQCSLALNVNTLYDQMVMTCGNQLCDKYRTDFRFPLLQLGPFNPRCGSCDCSDECIYLGTCCLDKFISLEVECVNATLRNFYGDDSNSIVEDHFIMKRSCLGNTTCSRLRPENKSMTNIPVIASNEYARLIYANKKCAACNNATFEKKLSLNWDCKQFADFNFVSSFDDMLRIAEKKECKLFSNIDYETRGCRKIYGPNTIQTCNVTGTWPEFDEDIEWACLHYDFKHHNFKNIFCLLCNPPIETEPIVSACNRTGLWDNYDYLIEQACLHYNTTIGTYPFKNVYCYICNKRQPFFYVEQSSFSEIDGNLEIDIQDKNTFQYTLKTTRIIEDVFYGNFPSESTATHLSTNISNPASEYKMNMTYISYVYYAITGQSDFCSENPSPGQDTGKCSCDENCHFNGYGRLDGPPCCLDAALKFSTTCTEPDPQSFLMYNGCEDLAPGFEYLKERCLSVIKDDVYSVLPVFDILSSVSYRNVYCSLCRLFRKPLPFISFSQIPSVIRLNHLDPFDIRVRCNSYLSQYFEGSLNEWLGVARKAGCEISHRPYLTVNAFESDVCLYYAECSRFTTCLNTTNVDRDRDVALACNHFNPSPRSHDFYFPNDNSTWSKYKNVFCKICSESSDLHTKTQVVNGCDADTKMNVSGETMKKCSDLDDIGYHYPYKNIFCKECNGLLHISRDTFSYKSEICNITFPREKDISFRSIFSLPSGFPQEDDVVRSSCDDGEKIYDEPSRQCRELKCFPGRILVNNSCTPFLSHTSDLYYVMSFGLLVTNAIKIENSKSFIHSMSARVIPDALRDHISERLADENRIYIFGSSIHTKKMCLADSWETGNFELSVVIHFTVSLVIERQKLENVLLSMMGFSFEIEQLLSVNGYYYNKAVTDIETGIQAVLIEDDRALFMPIRVQLGGLQEHCYYHFVYSFDMMNTPVSKVFVNELLECSHVEFKSDEFILDEKSLFIEIRNYGVISYKNYFLTNDNNLRICKHTFEELVSKKKSEDSTFWPIIMTICTVISLVAITFTFLTYCVLGDLRTTPGKNNMGLCIALFGTLFLGHFGRGDIESDAFCLAISIATHYFVLSLFCSLNVCTFHAHETFRNMYMKRHKTNGVDRKLILYFLFVFGLPFIIVLLNVGASYLWGSGVFDFYNSDKCFINNNLTFFISFVGPVGLSCVFNIVFYIMVVVRIAANPRPKQMSVSNSTKPDLLVYVKLFVLTGFSWGLQVVDSFFPFTYFSIIVSFLNAFEGLYLFLAFSANARVFNGYKTYFHSFLTSKSTLN